MIEIISIWFVIWFLLYYFDIIIYNPLIFLIISYLIILYETFKLYIKTPISIYNLIKYSIINIIIKLIPIILILLKSGFIIREIDILFGIYLIFFYSILLIILKINPTETYDRLTIGYIYNIENYKTPISKFYDYLFLLITNKMSS